MLVRMKKFLNQGLHNQPAQGIAPMSGYLGVFTIDINAVWPPEGTVYGQMAKQFAVRSELR